MSEHPLELGLHRLPAVSGSSRVDEAAMWLTCTAPGAVTRISVAGEIDMSNAHLLVEFVASLALPPPVTVEVDLSEVTFFCAHGISALLRARRLLADLGGRLTLRDPSPIVRRVLDITDAQVELEIVPAPSRPGPPARQPVRPPPARPSATAAR
ncbi:STAS domain-containing protein [Micromonospora halotolerans]|uniref:STAS domain-containing protein n=1 Tax=Micromonospora halotolerans TaxID=709879 RepID=A0ABZ0A1Z1_9ACTN|nr:STAS domain-containing protein [Micromonospora halotolerans]WNM41393.1 STAS domain-containing protein [Micromonospora halotolerans]